MRHHARLVLVAFIGAAVLAATVGSASARRIEISSSFRIVWRQLRFSERIEVGGNEARCPVTMEGTFHSRIISKVSGQLIGYMTRAALNSAGCTYTGAITRIRILNGTEGTATTLPWHMRYDSFTGTLPNITSLMMQIIGLAGLADAFGVSCLYQATAAKPQFFGFFFAEVPGEAASIPRFSGGILCPSSIFIEGIDTLTLLGSTAAITIRLVA